MLVVCAIWEGADLGLDLGLWAREHSVGARLMRHLTLVCCLSGYYAYAASDMRWSGNDGFASKLRLRSHVAPSRIGRTLDDSGTVAIGVHCWTSDASPRKSTIQELYASYCLCSVQTMLRATAFTSGTVAPRPALRRCAVPRGRLVTTCKLAPLPGKAQSSTNTR